MNAIKKMQPSECNQVNATKWMQLSECKIANATMEIKPRNATNQMQAFLTVINVKTASSFINSIFVSFCEWITQQPSNAITFLTKSVVAGPQFYRSFGRCS